MEALRFLNLDRNNLSTIPEGSLPKNLEKLYLGDCRLNQVPADVSKMEALLF